ncbi:hypothetical protein ACIF8W_28140 [Streptomyces sp. NPDC085639]|uniref:hypothetical protein n=1 Tax=Streptomyces sp. NPDC085639 TaxID=3365734 RepID=UPI0037CFD54A
MLLLEAVRQAAYRSAFPRRGVLTDREIRFFRHAELTSACWIETVQPVRVVAGQNGEVAFTATATARINATAPAPLRVHATPWPFGEAPGSWARRLMSPRRTDPSLPSGPPAPRLPGSPAPRKNGEGA